MVRRPTRSEEERMAVEGMMHKQDLAHIPLLAGMEPRLLELVTPDLVRHYPDGDVLFGEGEEADEFFVLLRGQVCIQRSGIFLAARRPFAPLGEQAFIDGTLRSATGVAQGTVRVLALPRALFERLMGDTAFTSNLLRALSEKLSEATEERAYRYRIECLLFGEFRAHVSPEVTQRLLSAGISYGSPGYIDAVILFSDIRSFTSRSAGMAPEQVAEQLTAYLDSIVGVIHAHDGLVDKFVGDAVMAVWGYAPSEGDIAVQAFECAREMVRTAAELRFGGQPIEIGVGLNAGRVFIGNVGGEEKRQFTVLGTPVNLAARFEAETKVLNVPVVMGQSVYERLPEKLRAFLTPYEGRQFRGAEAQTVYGLDRTVAETTGR
jgi:class 3 adenylate cyclase